MRALGPEAISTVVLQRLKRLPSDAPAWPRRSPSSARAPGRTAAAQLAGLDTPTAETALDALCRADIITRDADRIGFVHPIVLSAIYNDLPVHVRARSAPPRRSPAGRARRRAGGGRVAPRVDHPARRRVGGRGAQGRRSARARPRRPRDRGRLPGARPGGAAAGVDARGRPERARPRRGPVRPSGRGRALPRRDGARGHGARARPDRRRSRPRAEVPRRLAVRARRAAPRARRARPRPAGRGARARARVLGATSALAARPLLAAEIAAIRAPAARHARGSIVCT